MLKSALVIFFVSAVSATTLSEIEVKKISKSCADKNNIDIETFTKFDAQNKTPSKEYFCTSKCILEGLGGIDSEGNFVQSAVEEYIGTQIPADMKDDVLACLKKFPKVKECEDLNNIRQCMLPVVKKLLAQ